MYTALGEENFLQPLDYNTKLLTVSPKVIHQEDFMMNSQIVIESLYLLEGHYFKVYWALNRYELRIVKIREMGEIEYTRKIIK